MWILALLNQYSFLPTSSKEKTGKKESEIYWQFCNFFLGPYKNNLNMYRKGEIQK